MKLTNVLLRQHIGRHFKKHWVIQGQKVPRESNAFKALEENNIPIYEPKDILVEKKIYDKIDIVGLVPKDIPLNSSHPDWNIKPCHIYRNENVLLEGLNQAKSITKTIELQNGLPDLLLKKSSKEIDNRVKKIIMNSHIFDAQQEKLPKIKDPQRPSFNFPRIYGITNKRVNLLLTSKLMQLIEAHSGPQISKERIILNDLQFAFPFEKSGKLIQFMLRGDAVVMASKPLKSIAKSSGNDVELPDLFPIDDTVTLKPEHFYNFKNMYPVNKSATKRHPHTIFIHYNPMEVKNLYEEPVREDQILGHSLMKCFTAAASYAKEQYGESVTNLPKPVTLQCVNTDGQLFHFGILQLNTLDLDNREGIKNIWFHKERIALFKRCLYVDGQPVLEGYNSEVIKYLRAFYENV